MTVKYRDYSINIVDDQSYSPNSADNLSHYEKVYFAGSINEDRFYPTTKYGIRIYQENRELSSAIICEIGAGTIIHDRSFIISESSLYICCCDKVYSIKLPDLSLNWSKRLDPSRCFGIYSFDNNLVIHGELMISCIDQNGNVKWEFGSRDIFVTQDGTEPIIIQGDKILLKDWEGYKYTLNKNGVAVI